MSLFKRLFGIRKAKKGSEDTQVDFGISDLQKGYILDYDFRSWEVEDVVVYTWDNGVKDYEYNIYDGKEKQYLNYETIGEHVSIYWEGNMNEIWADARKKIRKNEDITENEFEYKGNTYYFSGEGSAKVKSSKETYHMQNWLFQNDTDETLISFNKYEDNSMEAYIGKRIKNNEISNILPR